MGAADCVRTIALSPCPTPAGRGCQLSLTAERVEIAKYPGTGQPPLICGEKGCPRVFEPPLRRRQPQQRPGMRAGEAKPCRRSPAVTHQLHDLVVKIGRALVHQVPVPPPPLPVRCLLPQRAAEGKARAERVLDRGLVPPVPQLAVEPLDQHADRDRTCTSWPAAERVVQRRRRRTRAHGCRSVAGILRGRWSRWRRCAETPGSADYRSCSVGRISISLTATCRGRVTM
jgi:hypothetical protein